MFESFGKQLRKPSGYYGRMVSRIMNRRNKLFYERIIRELDIKSGEKVFEIGYGPGLGINMIATTITDCSISGIDFSELMYREAFKRNKKFAESGIVQLQFGNFITQESVVERYDKVFWLNVIYFWPDLHHAYSKVNSFLNNHGVFCIFMTHKSEFKETGFSKDFNKYSIKTVEVELLKSGFQSVEFNIEKGYFIRARK